MLDDLPDGLVKYGQTRFFSATTVPDALLKAHTTKEGTWGRIVISKGRLLYRVLEPELDEIELSVDCFGIIEPEIAHEVKPVGDVLFRVEFYRRNM